MEIKLKKKPKNPIIIEGFPGFGLVGSIVTEFLIDHLNTEMIGKINLENIPAVVAIHESNVVEPLGVFYNKKYNIVILHAINPATGNEWKIADLINKLATDLNAKEIISLEGVGSAEGEPETTRTFYYSDDKKRKAMFKKIGVEPLKEGIIMGVTGAVLLRVEETPLSCIFAETHTNMPDSKAAARIVKVLDKYLKLKVDPNPL